jgi:carbonic anhydrase/acetyltransferase-like protein (isoleucine patch superfamily)
MAASQSNIRPNLAGDFPSIDPSALIDPSAQIIGNVQIDRDVFVGPKTVVRADQRGQDGNVAPIQINKEVNIGDGVIIHADPGASVTIGARTNVAHGCIILGPCTIGQECFIAVRSTLYKATLEDHVWLGIGAIVKLVTLDSFIKVPAGAVIHDLPEVMALRLVTDTEREYMEEVWSANSRLRSDYQELRDKVESLRSTSRKKAQEKDS